MYLLVLSTSSGCDKVGGFLFFKQKTAYEMRISDWSSDVCSSDLELATLRDAQRMSPALVMRDPYILDFLDLRDTWQESDLETAILREMESFLLELGAGFSVVARQKRIQIEDEDFTLDLLFYHLNLRRMEAVDLKGGEYTAETQGHMGV